MYNIAVWYLYIPYDAITIISSKASAAVKVITILMPYSLLYITPLWLMNFIIGSFYLLVLFTFLTYLPTSLSFGNHQFLLCTSEKMWIHTHTHTHTGILLSNKKEWSLAICNNTDGLEGMVLSRVSQADAVWFHLYVESKKNWTKKAKQKQAHRHREQTDVCMCPLREKKAKKSPADSPNPWPWVLG